MHVDLERCHVSFTKFWQYFLGIAKYVCASIIDFFYVILLYKMNGLSLPGYRPEFA